MSTASCRSELCFDVTKAAGLHAQFAGVLAGVAFTAIVLILEIRPEKTEAELAGVALTSFVGALVDLVVASFL